MKYNAYLIVFAFVMLASYGELHAINVQPDNPTSISMSNRDVNRVVCVNGNFNDAYYSEEKGINVGLNGKNAFVKYSIMQVGVEQQFVTQRSEFHFICDDVVYTILGNPIDIPGKIIYLGDENVNDIKEGVAKYSALPKEEQGRILTLTAIQDRGALPGHIKEKKEADIVWKKIDLKGKSESESSYIAISLLRSLKIAGTGLKLKEYRVIPDEQEYLDERRFLNTQLLNNPFQITVVPLNVRAGQEARLYVVEHSIN